MTSKVKNCTLPSLTPRNTLPSQRLVCPHTRLRESKILFVIMVGPEKDPGREWLPKYNRNHGRNIHGRKSHGRNNFHISAAKTDDMGILKGPIQGLILVSAIEGEKP